LTDRPTYRPRPRRGALLRLGAVLALALVAVAPASGLAVASPPPGAYRVVNRWPGADVQSPPGSWVQPVGVDVAVDGTVAVADTGNARVQLFGADGTFLRAFGRFGTGPGELVAPQDVALTPTRVLVTDPPTGRVLAWRRDGTPDGSWTGFAEPWGIAATTDRFVVTDRVRAELVLLSGDGTRLSTWGHEGSRGGEFRQPQGIAVAPDGELFVADTGNSRVQVLSPSGRYRDDFTVAGLGSAPTDIAADARGNIYVVGGGKAQWLERDGGKRVTPISALPVTEVAGVAVQPLAGLYLSRSAPAKAIGDVVRLPYQVRGATPNRTLGVFGGAMGRIVEPRRLVQGPNGSLVVLAAHTAASYQADGSFQSLLPTAPDDLVWLPDGDLVALSNDHLARLGPDGTVRWSWPGSGPAYPGPDAPDVRFTWLSHVVHDAAAGRLYVLDIGNGLLLHFGLDGALLRSAPIAADGTFAAYLDMTLRPDGQLALVNPLSGQIELRTPEGVLRRAVPVPGTPSRIDMDGENTFVLTADGWLWRFDAALQPEMAWEAADGGRPLDLVGAQDAVYVLDGMRNQVIQWAFSPDAVPGPPPPPANELRCSITPSATTDTPVVLLGESVEVRLHFDGQCPEQTPESDIMLVMDRSGSMLGDKLIAARAAAHAFLDEVDFTRNRVGLVAFSHEADLEQGLTADAVALHAAVDRLTAVGGTDIASGLSLAHNELAGARHRPSARRTVVLLTDGNSDQRSAIGAALAAKLAGTWLFSIGLGDDVNRDLLRRLASSPGDCYFAPTTDDLARVYTDIGRRIRADGLFRSATLTHRLPDGLSFAGMSAGPAPTVQGQLLVWSVTAVPFDGLGLRYRLRPQSPGYQASTVRTELDYIDGLGRGGWKAVALPWFTALAPRVIPTPAPSPTRAPWPSLYLPVLERNHCTSTRQHADVVLVLDTSNSMTELTGERSKLAAAVTAAGVFVDLMLPGDQVGLVTFNSGAWLAAPLGADAATMRAALAAAPTAPGTRIDLGLEAATAELVGAHHLADNSQVLILLTDGLPSQTSPAAVRASASAARAAGMEIFTIGLGADVDPQLLADIASAPDHVHLAPGGDDLDLIYRAIARTIPCR
jgi:Mg-chelatase subunit ChlD